MIYELPEKIKGVLFITDSIGWGGKDRPDYGYSWHVAQELNPTIPIARLDRNAQASGNIVSLLQDTPSLNAVFNPDTYNTIFINAGLWDMWFDVDPVQYGLNMYAIVVELQSMRYQVQFMNTTHTHSSTRNAKVDKLNEKLGEVAMDLGLPNYSQLWIQQVCNLTLRDGVHFDPPSVKIQAEKLVNFIKNRT